MSFWYEKIRAMSFWWESISVPAICICTNLWVDYRHRPIDQIEHKLLFWVMFLRCYSLSLCYRYLNDQRLAINERREIKDGDLISFGGASLVRQMSNTEEEPNPFLYRYTSWCTRLLFNFGVYAPTHLQYRTMHLLSSSSVVWFWGSFDLWHDQNPQYCLSMWW